MSKKSLEDICTLDDSTHWIRPHRSGNPQIHIYSHYLYDVGEDKGTYLIMLAFYHHFSEARPLFGQTLEEFIENNLDEDKKLYACAHYGIYPNLDKYVFEYTTRPLRKKAHRFVKDSFNVADRGARRVGVEVELFLKKKSHFKRFIKRLKRGTGMLDLNVGGFDVKVLPINYDIKVNLYF